MGDLIAFPGCELAPESPNHQCPGCGDDHWVAIVTFHKGSNMVDEIVEAPICLGCEGRMET